MSQRNASVSNIETAAPLTADQYLSMRVLYTQLTNSRLFFEGQSKKTTADMPKTLKLQTLPTDTLKIKSKVKDLSYNCNGTRLFVVCRESVSIVDIHSLALLSSLSVKCVKVLSHPIDPNVFALLIMDGSDNPKPCVRIYYLPQVVGATPDVKCSLYSTFDEVWYSGAWSLDGSTIAVVDRGNHLQCVDVTTFKDAEMKEDDAISLSTEVYGLIYTKDAFVVQKVDGKMEIFSMDLESSVVEQAHYNIILCSAYSAELDMLATGGSDHIVHLFSCAEDYTCVGTYPGLEGKVGTISFSPGGALLAWGTKDTMHYSTDSSGGNSDGTPEEEFFLTIAGTDPQEIYVQHKMPTAVTHVQFSPDSYTLAYACDLDTLPKNLGTNHMIGLIRI